MWTRFSASASGLLGVIEYGKEVYEMEHLITQWKWEAGRKRSGFLPVCGGGAELPVTLICGKTPGPAVLISAGVHNAEYVGIQAAVELAQELEPEQLTGSVALIHLMNPTGYEHRTMSLVYEDEKNLNRIFPGKADGTLGERIAFTVTETFLRHADAYLDLHSGDGYEELTPYVYCQGAAEKSVAEKSRAMASLVDVPYLVPSQTTTGGAYNHAGSMGVPGILIERGGLGLWSREEVEADKKDVRNLLRSLGVLGGEMEPQLRRPVEVSTVIYENSRFNGCWHPRRKAGDRVQKGEVLGEVRDYFGNLLQVCEAELDGVLLYQTRSLSIVKDGPMVAYGALSAGPGVQPQCRAGQT